MKEIKLLSFILILVLGYSNFSFSQPGVTTAIPSGTARFEALGSNPFIKDAAIDINRNPAWGGIYRNYAFGDIGRFSSTNGDKDSAYVLRDQYAGVNFRLGNQWSGGLVVNKNEGEIFGGDIRATYENLGIKAPIVPIKLLLAVTTGKLNVGFAPYFARWSAKFQEDTIEGKGGIVSLDNSSSIFGGTVGILSLMKSTSWIEGAIDVKSNKYESKRTDSTAVITFENTGGLEMDVFFRGWLKSGSSSVHIVPYINFSMFSFDPTRTPVLVGSATDEHSKWSILGGIGINLPVAGDGMLGAGLSGGYVQDKTTTTSGSTGSSSEAKFTSLILPQFNVGLEWNLTDWLQGRVGFARAVVDQKSEFTSTGTATSSIEFSELIATDPNQTITLGLGWQVDRFSIDGLVGERFFQTGPHILSGKENDLFGTLSVSYNFRVK